MKVLVVDDDLELLGLVAYALRQSGYLALEAPDGRSGLETFRSERPDLVILDVNLPRMSGFDVLREIRESGDRTPVMMLTVRSDEQDQVGALDLGADDYLTKPFSPRTLTARVRALLRRAGAGTSTVATAGSFALDLERQTVRIDGVGTISLTTLEFRLLQRLIATAGLVVSAERLTTHVWGLEGYGDKQRLKQLVHRLRTKIEPDPQRPRYLLTEAGQGYRFDAG